MRVIKRKTFQRDAITGVLKRENRPMTAREILNASRKGAPSLNQSTVYRNLKSLVLAGQLRTVHHPDLGTLYEPSNAGHHHYFHCRKCDKSFSIPGCGLNQKETLPPGVIVEDHQVFLFGICSHCNSGY